MTAHSLLPDFKPPEGIRLAFFDLDETITYRDTDLLWALWRSRRSFKGFRDLLRLGRINRLYYSHRLTAEDYSAYHLKRACSMTLEQYRRKAAAFAAHSDARYIYPSIRELLTENRQRGILNVLITAQDEIIGGAFRDILKLDDCLASTYSIVMQNKAEKIVGMNEPLCYQEGKVHWAKKYLEGSGIDWSECAFYTDSLNDLPLLEACHFSVAVHPGEELEALAVDRSWPVFKPDRPLRP